MNNFGQSTCSNCGNDTEFDWEDIWHAEPHLYNEYACFSVDEDGNMTQLFNEDGSEMYVEWSDEATEGLESAVNDFKRTYGKDPYGVE